MPIKEWLIGKIKINNNLKEVTKTICMLAIFVICIAVSVRATYNPFIYFNF